MGGFPKALTTVSAPGDEERFVPAPGTPFQGTLQPNYYCRAWNRRREKYCSARAGNGTLHPGSGRCSKHTGSVERGALAIKGRYLALKHIRLKQLFEEFSRDPDPLNMTPEVIMGRALFTDFVERYDEMREALLAWKKEGKGDVPPLLDIADAHRILDSVGKMVERIERVRSQNAITRPELNRIFHEMWRAVDSRIVDEKVKEQIREDWLRVRL